MIVKIGDRHFIFTLCSNNYHKKRTSITYYRWTRHEISVRLCNKVDVRNTILKEVEMSKLNDIFKFWSVYLRTNSISWKNNIMDVSIF